MWNVPENIIDPPENYHCHSCGTSFYPRILEEWDEDDTILCYECADFDG